MREAIGAWSAAAGLRAARGCVTRSAWLLPACLALSLCSACGIRADSLDTSSVNVMSEEAQVKALMHEIFPELTSSEVDELSANLTLDAALGLKLEMTNMRAVAVALSQDLADAASAAAKQRQTDLAPQNGGFPAQLEPVGRSAVYDSAHGEARVDLSGVFSDRTAVALADGEVSVQVSGNAQAVQLSCVGAEPVDIVFLVDVTGSMTPVIGAVQRSLQAFVNAIVDKGVQGTLAVVTFQDSVGVNISFQEPLGASGYERSPFFKPVDIADATGVAQLQRFIARLEADSGADIPENLAGAIDFAQNNTIGLMKNGAPNVMGDGLEDPQDVGTFPKLMNARHIFVAFTDAPFHSDSRDQSNSSLLAPFKPRPIASILKTLQAGGTTVHVSDPSWVDESVTPTGAPDEVEVDSDYWAINTGGLGEDRVGGYSLTDLDLLVTAQDSGLLDILLDSIVASTCTARFPLPSLAANASFDLSVTHGGETFSASLAPTRY